MSRSRIFALTLCLFALVVGARWALYNRFGTDVPQTDQWDAEGQVILHPWAAGNLHFGDFFRAHNEHRVALTRFLNLGLVKVNGQWDQRLEAAVNALLAATLAMLLWRVAAARLGLRWQIAFFLLVAALYTLPVAWQNTLSGFDSQQFFLIGLAFGTIATLPMAEPFRPAWWGGAVCALLSLGSMGSGFFAAGVAGAMLVFQVWRGDRRLRSAAPGLAVCAAVVALGVMTREIVPGNEPLKAQSFGDLFMTAVKALGWPAYDFNWGFSSLILFVPWALVTVRVLRPRNRGPNRWTEFLSGLGFWVLFQVLATAYARGAGAPLPASRYVDTLVIGSIVNLLCLHALWQTPDLPKPSRDICAVFIGGWGFLFTLGLVGSACRAFTGDLPPLVPYNFYSEQNTRNYLITGDEAYLNHDEIPYPAAWALVHDLKLSGISEMLPASVRLPLPLAAAVPAPIDSSAGFRRCDGRVPESLDHLPRVGRGIPSATPVLSNAITWGSFGRDGVRTLGVWRSQPQRAVYGGWLKFEVAGDTDQPGVALELRDPATDRVLAEVKPGKSPGNSWRSAWVRAPRGEFVVAARDESRTGWLAFSEPIEMSRGSHWAWRAVRSGGLIAALAGALGLGLLAAPRKRS